MALRIVSRRGSTSGAGYNDWVKNNFVKWVKDDQILVLVMEATEMAGETDKGPAILALMCVNLVGPSESYWHSLRVQPSLRNRGCGKTLVSVAQDLMWKMQVGSSRVVLCIQT